jgi:hypothetical protein
MTARITEALSKRDKGFGIPPLAILDHHTLSWSGCRCEGGWPIVGTVGKGYVVAIGRLPRCANAHIGCIWT